MAHADKIGVKVYVSDFGTVVVPEEVLAAYEIGPPPIKPCKRTKGKWGQYLMLRKEYIRKMKLYDRNMSAICCHEWMMGRDLEIK